MAHRHPDELSADFRRLYGVDDWSVLPPLTAAAWCAAMVRQPESWTHRAINPEWRWEDPTAHAQALAADYLATLVWLKTKNGTKGRHRPKPFPRPGVDGWHTPGQAGVTRDEVHGMAPEDLDAALAAARV